MDGVLMEWEKMLPNPDEIDDIDNSDMIESQLPIFEGKNQLPTVLDTTNTSDKGAGEITPKLGEITPKLGKIKQVESRTLQDIHKGEVTGDRSGSRQTEMTSLLNLESEDNEKTVKLIDELNPLKDLDDIPKNSSQISEASGEESSKDCESVNTSGYATCQQTSNDSIIDDNKVKYVFENCVDSPLQISDVRTGDILSQRALAENIKDCGNEKETNLQRNIRLGYIIPDEDGQTNEGHGQLEVGFNMNTLESGLHEKDTENEKGCNEIVLNEDKRTKVFKQLKEHLKRGGFSEKEDTIKKSKFDEYDIGNGKIADNKKDEISLSQNCDTPEVKKHSEISPLNNNITAANMGSIRLNNNKADTSLAENTFVMLTVKDEPKDYEEYGKFQEFEKLHEDVNNEHIGFSDNFMSNFYSDMDSGRNSEINYNEQIDYRCKITEAGLYQCLYCSARLINSAQFQNHLAERHKTMYQCKHCDMNFYRSQDLAIHCRIRHTEERVKIQNKSLDSSPNKSIIKKRKSKVYLDEDGNQIYKCAHCSKKFRVQQAMASHVRNVHYNNSKEKVKPSYDDEGYQIYECRYTSCDEKFHRKLDLSLHVKTEHKNSAKKNKKAQVYYDDDGIQIYKCRYCSEGFRIQQAMASHVRNVHRYNFNVKENVKKTTSDTTDNPSSDLGESKKADDEKLEESVREENETKAKSREFTKRVLPYRNMSFETDANQIEESLANSDCSLKRELKSNQIYHCSKCTKWFYREKQVFNHEKTCTGIKQEPALLDDNLQDSEIHDGIVDEQSNRVREGHVKKELKENMDVHDVKKFKEKMQQKKEKTRQNGHGSVGNKKAFSFLPKFFCKYCPSSYEEGKIMNLHLVKHLGEVLLMAESKYKCCICSKTFGNRTKMMYHLQNHTSFDITKLYKQTTIPECSICGQPFVNELLLEKHQNKHSKIDTHVMTPSSKAIAIDSTTPSGRSNIKVIYSANGSKSVSNIRNKLQIESIGSTSLSSGGDSFSIVKEKTVSLDDIPFQCGMCLSRFPTSQYLLHHITLHMQGPYVFKIEMDKKEKEDGENGEKILPHGNISFAGRSRLLPTSIPKTVNGEGNIHIVKCSTTSSDNPLTLKMPANFKKCQEENIIHASNSISGSQTGTKSDFTMHAIANDHMYTNSLLQPQKKDDALKTGDDEMPREDHNSDTESAISSEAESSAYYDTDECEKIENDVRNKTVLPRKIKIKKDTPSQRVSTFRKCFDIASGKWFECPYCLHISQTEKELRYHMQNHDLNDLPKMVQCCYCNRKFVSKWHLSKHMEHSHRRNSYKCSFCDQGFLTSFEVMEHVQKVHQY